MYFVKKTLFRHHSNLRLLYLQNVPYFSSVQDCFPEKGLVSAISVASWPDKIGNSCSNLVFDVEPPISGGPRAMKISLSFKEKIQLR
jgi:hypothetical protein